MDITIFGYSFDDTLKFLRVVEPIAIYIIAIVVFLCFKLNKIYENSKTKIKEAIVRKNKEVFNNWLHNESRYTILKIKELCNVYFDKSHADNVLYIQFENGTTATNKLSNMYITCIAEDNRYGEITKKCANVQRIPYNDVASWIEDNNSQMFVCISNIDETCKVLKRQLLFSDVNSTLSISIHDLENNFIGIAIFNYKDANLNGGNEEEEVRIITKFKNSIETVFFSYHILIQDKKKELEIND